MCGRYVLSMRPSVVRQRLADQDMPAEEAPDDDDDRIRQSYNFPPGATGLIYRANTSDRGAGAEDSPDSEHIDGGEPSPKKAKLSHPAVDGLATKETKYKLQAARWGLIPFWTKRAPDYASQMRTINCRDDSLIENRGMWNTMKQRKRCVVVAEGFYEWLKKNGGKEKIPHLTKRKDGQLMCFAGLWDMVQYEDSTEKLYTYTVITTDSNKQLKFLHDRMPVILEPGSEEMKIWLDPNKIGWDKELQSMLKPYEGELECYPVDKAVGKVGNNSPSFLIPIDSKENKNNIMNFFGNQRATAKDVAAKNEAARQEKEVIKEEEIKQDPDEDRETSKVESTEDNAPLPKPEDVSHQELSQRIDQDSADLSDETIIKAADEQVEMDIERSTAEIDDNAMAEAIDKQLERGIKREISEIEDAALIATAADSPPGKAARIEKPKALSAKTSPAKKPTGKRSRNATSNEKIAKTPTKDGNAKITSFFGK